MKNRNDAPKRRNADAPILLREGVSVGLSEGSNSPLPQLEPSVHGLCNHTEGEGEG